MKKVLKKWKKRQKKCRKHGFFEISQNLGKKSQSCRLKLLSKTTPVLPPPQLRKPSNFHFFSLFFTFFHFLPVPRFRAWISTPKPPKKVKKTWKKVKKSENFAFCPKHGFGREFRPQNPKKCTNFAFFCMFCARFFHVLYPQFQPKISTPKPLKKVKKKCPFWGFFDPFPNATVENSLQNRRNPAKRLRCLFKYIYREYYINFFKNPDTLGRCVGEWLGRWVVGD